MQCGKESASLGVMRVECEEFLESGGRPAVLAGVHLRDGVFEERALLAVPDDTPLVPSGGILFIGFYGRFFVSPHVTTLADHSLIERGSTDCISQDTGSV
jgi:hypothetical protein